MCKSIIPFIFENTYLNKIFIEAESCTTASHTFCFQNFNLEKIKKSKLKILLTDNASLIKIANQDINLDIIFLVNETNEKNSDLNISSEVININIPFKMNDIYQRIEKDQ